MKQYHDCLDDVNENKYRLLDGEQEEAKTVKHIAKSKKTGQDTALQRKGKTEIY